MNCSTFALYTGSNYYTRAIKGPYLVVVDVKSTKGNVVMALMTTVTFVWHVLNEMKHLKLARCNLTTVRDHKPSPRAQRRIDD